MFAAHSTIIINTSSATLISGQKLGSNDSVRNLWSVASGELVATSVGNKFFVKRELKQLWRIKLS